MFRRLRQTRNVTLTLNVPDDYAAFLPVKEEEIAAVLSAGLSHWKGKKSREFQDLTDVTEALAELPTPQEVLAMRPSPVLAQRTSELLEKSKSQALTAGDQAEWEQILRMEHVMRIAKSKALIKMKANDAAA